MVALTHWVCFLFFLIKITVDVVAPVLWCSVSAVCLSGLFPYLRERANVNTIPKGPPSSSVANYRPISITSVLLKVFDRWVSVCLGRFMERRGVLLTTKFDCDALFGMTHTLQIALEYGQYS